MDGEKHFSDLFQIRLVSLRTRVGSTEEKPGKYEAFYIFLSILSQSGLAWFVCVPVTVAHSLLFWIKQNLLLHHHPNITNGLIRLTDHFEPWRQSKLFSVLSITCFIKHFDVKVLHKVIILFYLGAFLWCT